MRGAGPVATKRCWEQDTGICADAGRKLLRESWRKTAVGEWVRLCGMGEAPEMNTVMEAEACGRDGVGVPICLANVEGRLSALGNVCPHREGPLGAGWVEEGMVMCPWHAWAFDVTTGVAAAPEKGRVAVYPVRVEGGDVLVELK